MRHMREHSLQVFMLQEHLLKQGNVEQSPVTFLSQENTDSKLLVIIKNADIAGKIHTVSHCCVDSNCAWLNTRKTWCVDMKIPFVEFILFILNCRAKMITILENS